MRESKKKNSADGEVGRDKMEDLMGEWEEVRGDNAASSSPGSSALYGWEPNVYQWSKLFFVRTFFLVIVPPSVKLMSNVNSFSAMDSLDAGGLGV